MVGETIAGVPLVGRRGLAKLLKGDGDFGPEDRDASPSTSPPASHRQPRGKHRPCEPRRERALALARTHPPLSKGSTTWLCPSSPRPGLADAEQETLTRTAAVSRLEVHVASVDKMVRAGMLPLPITAASVARFIGLSKLVVVEGALTVLRTDARQPVNPVRNPDDDRAFIGFHVEHSNEVLEQTSLRWWRSDPTRVLDNELFAVTVVNFPVAVYRVTELVGSTSYTGEEHTRHQYAGEPARPGAPRHGAVVRGADGGAPQAARQADHDQPHLRLLRRADRVLRGCGLSDSRGSVGHASTGAGPAGPRGPTEPPRPRRVVAAHTHRSRASCRMAGGS